MKTKTWIEMGERNATTFMLTLCDFDQGDESCALAYHLEAPTKMVEWNEKWSDEEEDPMWYNHMGQTQLPKGHPLF